MNEEVRDNKLPKQGNLEKENVKASFLSNISHELRTPVNVILGFTNLLTDPGYGEDQKKFFLQEINQNSKKLLRIIDNLIYSAERFCPLFQ